MQRTLAPTDVKNLWARQYLIDTFKSRGRSDINGLALTLGTTVDEVQKEFADLLRFLEPGNKTIRGRGDVT